MKHLEQAAATERDRWLELLSYIDALVYHDRATEERTALHELIVASVQTDGRREVETMFRSGADVLKEEGRCEGELLARKQMLLLRARFKRVPKAIERAVSATEDVGRLDTWIERFATADTLDDVGITPGP